MTRTPASSPAKFIDSNIILYLASGDTAKADRAEAVIAGGGVISVQVLNELANVARRKMNMTWSEVQAFLAPIRATLRIEPLTDATHESGLRLAERYGLSVYDAMIVASALLAECDALYSEDMQPGLLIEGQMRIVNPFEG